MPLDVNDQILLLDLTLTMDCRPNCYGLMDLCP